MSDLYDIGSDYSAVVAELSGADDIGDDDLAGLATELGFDQLGFEQLGADERAVLGAAKRIIAKGGGGSLAAMKKMMQMAASAAAAKNRGFGLLAKDQSPQGAFGMKGSLNLLSFTGTVNGGGTLTVPANLDRRSTIRELRAEGPSTVLRVTNFSAAGLPFGALRFPFSLSSFGPNVQDRNVRPQTYDASINFTLTVSNPTGAPVDMLLEAWGTPS